MTQCCRYDESINPPFYCFWDVIIDQAAVLGIALVASGEDVGSEVR